MRRRQVQVELPAVSVDGIPAEFLNVEDSVWGSRKSTAAFMDRLGLSIDPWLTVSSQNLDYGPTSRYRVVVLAWSVAHGFGQRNQWNFWCADWEALTEAGITDDVFTPRRERWRYVCSKYGPTAPAN